MNGDTCSTVCPRPLVLFVHVTSLLWHVVRVIVSTEFFQSSFALISCPITSRFSASCCIQGGQGLIETVERPGWLHVVDFLMFFRMSSAAACDHSCLKLCYSAFEHPEVANKDLFCKTQHVTLPQSIRCGHLSVYVKKLADRLKQNSAWCGNQDPRWKGIAWTQPNMLGI